ncbi:MAG: hypothetical protein DME50_16385 [Verrucomicrobia bacterium]|nr:MAG: hypothetical protein DME50_16385 [Verrucomicrobiota bacterium]
MEACLDGGGRIEQMFPEKKVFLMASSSQLNKHVTDRNQKSWFIHPAKERPIGLAGMIAHRFFLERVRRIPRSRLAHLDGTYLVLQE